MENVNNIDIKINKRNMLVIKPKNEYMTVGELEELLINFKLVDYVYSNIGGGKESLIRLYPEATVPYEL